MLQDSDMLDICILLDFQMESFHFAKSKFSSSILYTKYVTEMGHIEYWYIRRAKHINDLRYAPKSNQSYHFEFIWREVLKQKC